MKALILLIALIVVTGCGHTHPIAEHEHPHEHDHHHSHQHDHTHESETVALHKALVGKYRLEAYNDGNDRKVHTNSNNKPDIEELRGQLTITLDYKFVIVVEESLYEDFIDTVWDHYYPFSGDVRYYRIMPDMPVFTLHDSAFSRFAWYHSEIGVMNFEHCAESEWFGSCVLQYEWDGTVLTLMWHSSWRDNPTTMKWRKLG